DVGRVFETVEKDRIAAVYSRSVSTPPSPLPRCESVGPRGARKDQARPEARAKAREEGARRQAPPRRAGRSATARSARRARESLRGLGESARYCSQQRARAFLHLRHPAPARPRHEAAW